MRKKKGGKKPNKEESKKMPVIGGLTSNSSTDEHLFFGVGTQGSIDLLRDLSGNRHTVHPNHFWPVQMTDGALLGNRPNTEEADCQHQFLYYS